MSVRVGGTRARSARPQPDRLPFGAANERIEAAGCCARDDLRWMRVAVLWKLDGLSEHVVHLDVWADEAWVLILVAYVVVERLRRLAADEGVWRRQRCSCGRHGSTATPASPGLLG
jgi:hypothetical protein